MNDYEKLRVIEKICLKRGLAKKRQLDSWILKIGLVFTSQGDALPDEVYSVENKYDLNVIINGVEKQEFITLILEALSGILVFRDTEIETLFWEQIVKRFRDDFKIQFPKILVPKNIILPEFY